jgi:hypothetical protein
MAMGATLLLRNPPIARAGKFLVTEGFLTPNLQNLIGAKACLAPPKGKLAGIAR